MSAHAPPDGHERLSRRELEVARLVAEGLTNREIAARLFLSERTVDGHLEHIREKLGFNSRAQVAAWVVRQGQPSVASARPSQARAGSSKRIRILVAGSLIFATVAFAAIELFREPPSPEIVTIAGTQPRDPTFPIGSYSGDEVPATSTELARPSSIAPMPGGAYYFADYGNARIRTVDAQKIIHTIAGGGPSSPANGALATSVALAFPSAIAVDRSGRLYLLTFENGALEVWSVGAGPFLRLDASLPTTNYQPDPFLADPVGGLAVAGDGTSLYVADRAANKVYRVSPGQQPAVLAGTGQPGFGGDRGQASQAQLDSPVGLALDERRDCLYIADVGNNRIRRVDLKTQVIDTFAGGDDYGNTGDGGPARSARLKIPFGVAIGPDGTVYIADTGNNRIREVTPALVIQPLAGDGVGGFTGDDGPATGAELNGPEAIAVAPNGNLLIADTFNQRIRELLIHQ